MEFLSVIDLRVDALPSGMIFVSSPQPSFSWRMISPRSGAMQRSYRITAKDADNGNVLWDSGVVDSGVSTGIRWGGGALKSRCRVKWQVSVVDDHGNAAVSAEAFFETPLFRNSDWSAEWISFDGNNPAIPSPLPYFRKEFTLKNVSRARLYAGCRGIFELHINGKVVSPDRMAPGWSDFSTRIQYLSYDVTAMLKTGGNTIGAIVGDGWYCSYLSGRRRSVYGEYPELLLQLEVVHTDGSTALVTTGENWKTATGPYLRSDIYDGEFYDARLEMPGWDECGFDDSKWRNARIGGPAADSPALVPKCCVPVREIEELKPVKFTRTKNNELIWDFGQNISGGIRIRNLKAHGNLLFTIKYGEMLNPDGSLYNQNFRSALSTDYYTTGGGDSDAGMEYETRFTFHGFRYVQIEGPLFAGVDPESMDVSAVVLHSELESTGSFECGYFKLNRLYQNICWGQRDNFLEIPTDCPQRDERLGWTGDAQIFCGTAAINMNVFAFFRKWLGDLRDAQAENGMVSHIAPNIWKGNGGAAAWADAAAICPWTIYMAYGDPQILEENFDMMRRWVDYQKESSENLIRPQTAFGDWLALSKVKTPSPLIGTAYFVRSAEFTGRAAEVLGKTVEAEYYLDLSKQIRDAFCKNFLDSDGIVTPATQTGLSLALHFGILPEKLRSRNAAVLDKMIAENGDKLDTGFVGTGCLNLALSENDYHARACELYLQEEYPSWLFSVNQGATTMWERWNSYTVKDGFGDVNMNSFNHYAYGAVHEWVMRHICGIQLVSPGGRDICFAVEPDRRLGFVNSSLKTPYGKVESCWKIEDNKLFWHIAAPANTRMKVIIPSNWSGNVPTDLSNGVYDLVLTAEK